MEMIIFGTPVVIWLVIFSATAVVLKIMSAKRPPPRLTEYISTALISIILAHALYLPISDYLNLTDGLRIVMAGVIALTCEGVMNQINKLSNSPILNQIVEKWLKK